jgi:hypothetical protein
MRYMIMMMTPAQAPSGDTGNASGGNAAQDGDWGVMQWAPEDLSRHIKWMQDLDVELRGTGELVDAQGLAAPGTAKIVTCDGGEPVVSDGPFAESKEFLAGYWVVDVDSEQRVLDLAARISSAPAQGGKPLGMPIEVRAIGVAPEVD